MNKELKSLKMEQDGVLSGQSRAPGLLSIDILLNPVRAWSLPFIELCFCSKEQSRYTIS
jgi:hypothetical protein